MWVWDIVHEYFPALHAGDLRDAITAACAPYMSRYDRSSLVFELNALALALSSPPQRSRQQQTEKDPEKAAEWFASMGYRVVKSG